MAEAVSSNPPAKRKPGQYRLISLFVVMLVVSLPLAWLAIFARQSREQAAAEEKINERGGRVESYFGAYTSIDLDHGSIKDDDLVLVKEFPDLEYLFLGGTAITDAGLVHLEKLEELGWLDLRDTAVTDAGLERLKGLKKLRMLRYTGSKVTKEGFEKLQKSIPLLETDKSM